MTKDEYLKTQSVQSFINWIQGKLDKPNSFTHKYVLKRPKGVVWECDSIFSAYENYDWDFSYTDTRTNTKIKGKTFIESKNTLLDLSKGLRASLKKKEEELFVKFCFATLDWGGVLPKNDAKISQLNPGIIEYFVDAINRLNPETFNMNDNYKDIIMNAGFTKIYSLLIDDFIIYDGRVGAALGLLVRKFCEEKKLMEIPAELKFAYGIGKESKPNPELKNRRNPSTEVYIFPVLRNSYHFHTENNMRANWLVKQIIESCPSKFNKLNENIQLRAFESALFMIGYDVTC